MCCFMLTENSSFHELQDKIKLMFTFWTKYSDFYEKDKYKEKVANKGEIFETLYFASQYSFGAGNHKKNNVHL